MSEKEILERLTSFISGKPKIVGGAHCAGCLAPVNADPRKLLGPGLCTDCCERIASALSLAAKQMEEKA